MKALTIRAYQSPPKFPVTLITAQHQHLQSRELRRVLKTLEIKLLEE